MQNATFKNFLRFAAVALAMSLCALGAQAQTTTVGANASSALNSTNGAYNSGVTSTLQNTFTSPADSTVHQEYSGTYTVKANTSVVLGAFAPSMSSYNCAATGQIGGSGTGFTGAFGIPLLLTPGEDCLLFTAANMNVQIAQAIAPANSVEAFKHINAANNLLCAINDTVKSAMRAAGLACALNKDELAQQEAHDHQAAQVISHEDGTRTYGVAQTTPAVQQ